MRVKVLIFIGVVALTGFAFSMEVETTTQRNSPDVLDEENDRITYDVEDPEGEGFWKKKYVLRPRWVKNWEEKKIYVAVWKHMWGPVEVKEWVPVPKPPPGWEKPNAEDYFEKFPH